MGRRQRQEQEVKCLRQSEMFLINIYEATFNIDVSSGRKHKHLSDRAQGGYCCVTVHWVNVYCVSLCSFTAPTHTNTVNTL